jgi:hypothetical protein
MDAERFDQLARTLLTATSRRGLGLLLVGGTLVRAEVVDGRKKPKKPKNPKNKDKIPCEKGGHRCPAEKPICCGVSATCCPGALANCCKFACCPNDPAIVCGTTPDTPCVRRTP